VVEGGEKDGMILVRISCEKTIPTGIMQATIELLGSALFAMLMLVQIGLVLMIGLAKLFRSMGLIKDGEKADGWRGFLTGFS
jgi:hypothetical protein